mgnify:CR=1 FL=1|tara:strand:- start:902 stop:1780 length:879 start_codon:yes stop_codon:yes gene_type:complete
MVLFFTCKIKVAMFLTKEKLDFFRRDGFLVLEDFVSIESCESLRERAIEIVENFDHSECSPIFTTREQTRNSDSYFLSSGDKISCFFEEEAFNSKGELKQSKLFSINKIGHAMHDLDPVFEKFSRTNNLEKITNELGFKDPKILQSMFIFKQPFIGGEVICHQDSTFLYTRPLSVNGFWFALEDSSIENGCLWAIPGGHKKGLKSRFFRKKDGEGTEMEIFDDSPWEISKLVPLEVRTGTMIVLHGSLPHMSYANRSKRTRHAYTMHLIEGGSYYPKSNWLQRPSGMPLRGF